MLNKDNIDLKIILSLTDAYENLYEKGEITEEQLKEVFIILDNYQDYSAEEVEKKIGELFED
ncbi:MAG: hypothetical protein ACOCQB_00765 [Halanaerobiaceae bacterium]